MGCDVKNILLISMPAIATSLLIMRVVEAAAQQGVGIKITTLSEAEGLERLNEFDAILFSPHLRFLVGKFGNFGNKPNMRAAVIDSVTYGSLDGEAVLQTINQLLFSGPSFVRQEF